MSDEDRNLWLAPAVAACLGIYWLMSLFWANAVYGQLVGWPSW